MNLSDLTPFLLHKFSSEHDLVVAIEEISKNFTTTRERIEDYLKDPRLVSAYTAFYLTTNFPKLEHVMKWMPEAWKTDLKRSALIDVGAGPGTFSLAFRAWASSEFAGEVFQLEKSSVMREQAKKIWQGLYPDATLHQNVEVKSELEKFLIFGHSANEMGVAATLEVIKKNNPDHILFIEPGTKSFFPDMLKIRQGLLSSEFNVLFPCPTADRCPMQGSSEDWCHQFIEVSHSADIERLTQLVKKDRKLLPLTVHAYSKKSYGKNPSERLVRVLPETKFSFEWEVCQNNALKKFQVMKRTFSKSEEKKVARILAGSALEIEVEKETEQSTRVKLISLDK